MLTKPISCFHLSPPACSTTPGPEGASVAVSVDQWWWCPLACWDAGLIAGSLADCCVCAVHWPVTPPCLCLQPCGVWVKVLLKQSPWTVDLRQIERESERDGVKEGGEDDDIGSTYYVLVLLAQAAGLWIYGDCILMNVWCFCLF